MTKQFRPCAIAVVFNTNGDVLLGNRIDTPNDAWQFPQGGIEKGETPQQAAKRELFEETGITSVKVIYTDTVGTRYNFPQSVKETFEKQGIFTEGQEAYFTLFYFTGEESEINLTACEPEFKQYSWAPFAFALEQVVPFKKESYLSAAVRLKPLIKQYLDSIS